MTMTDDSVFGAAATDEELVAQLKADEEALKARRAKLTPKIIDESGDVVAAPVEGAEIAKTDDVKPPPPWPHQVIEDFYGMRLEVRKPQDQAMAGLSFASSKFTPPEIQRDAYNMFLIRHLSPLSYGEVIMRTMEPPESPDAFTPETIGELINLLVSLPPKDKTPDKPIEAG